MLFDVSISGDMVLDRIDPHWIGDSRLPGQCVPTCNRHRALAAAVPHELAKVGDDDCRMLTVFSGLNSVDELQGGTRSNGFLSDDTMGKDSKVLRRFSKVYNQAFCDGDVRGGEDRDVWV